VTWRRPTFAQLTRGPVGVVTVVLMTVALVSLSYRAVAEWQRAAAMTAERRARATVDMFVTAFVRDMRGAQLSLLAPAHVDDPSDLNDRVSSGFARFQYPESFFVWRDPPDPGTLLLYVRTDRYPPWLPAPAETAYLPMVSTTADRAIARSLTNRLAGECSPSPPLLDFQFRSRRHSVPGRHAADLRGSVSRTPRRRLRLYREPVVGAAVVTSRA